MKPSFRNNQFAGVRGPGGAAMTTAILALRHTDKPVGEAALSNANYTTATEN